MQMSEQELVKQNEHLQWQLAELTILSSIKKSEGIGDGSGSGDEKDNSSEGLLGWVSEGGVCKHLVNLLLIIFPAAVLEKYWETRRELEMLRQRMSTERDDEIERLQHSKKGLEKRVGNCYNDCLVLFYSLSPSLSLPLSLPLPLPLPSSPSLSLPLSLLLLSCPSMCVCVFSWWMQKQRLMT